MTSAMPWEKDDYVGTEEGKQILQMIADGKVSPEEGQRLLVALGEQENNKSNKQSRGATGTSSPTWKVLLAVGLMIGGCAIGLALIGGINVKWTSGANVPSNVGISIGYEWGMTSAIFGALAIITLMLGGVFLALSMQRGAETDKASSATSLSFSFMAFIQNLHKSSKDCMIGGVCGGLGEHSPIPSWLWRMFFLVLLLCFGTGLLAYIILWICMPEAQTLLKQDTNNTPGSAVANPVVRKIDSGILVIAFLICVVSIFALYVFLLIAM